MRIAQWTGLWALMCLCSIVAPGVADADWKIDRAKAVASKAWGNPCPGRAQILFAPPQQPSWLASTIRSSCQITLSDREAWPWKQLCPVLVHEYGHLAGYRDPLNPSYPFHSHGPGQHHVRVPAPGFALQRLRDAVSRLRAAARLPARPRAAGQYRDQPAGSSSARNLRKERERICWTFASESPSSSAISGPVRSPPKRKAMISRSRCDSV